MHRRRTFVKLREEPWDSQGKKKSKAEIHSPLLSTPLPTGLQGHLLRSRVATSCRQGGRTMPGIGQGLSSWATLGFKERAVLLKKEIWRSLVDGSPTSPEVNIHSPLAPSLGSMGGHIIHSKYQEPPSCSHNPSKVGKRCSRERQM